MSAMLGQSLNGLKDLPILVVLMLICLSAQVLTEFASNVAIANVMLPVLAQLSAEMQVHPLFLMFPAALSCSMAFHMPVGTPPNAIVAGVANIATKDMVSIKTFFISRKLIALASTELKNYLLVFQAVAGIGSTLITFFVIWLGFPLYAPLIYTDLNTYPEWAYEAIVGARNVTGRH